MRRSERRSLSVAVLGNSTVAHGVFLSYDRSMEELMRAILISVFLGLCPALAIAQSNTKPDVAQSKMECRRLVPGQNNFISSNETLINGLACHTVKPAVSAATAPQPVIPAPTAPPAEATICFYRISSLVGAAIHPSIFIDDGNVGSLGRGQKFAFTVSAGKHHIHSTAKNSSIDLDAKAGQTYYVRLSLEGNLIREHGSVTLVSAQQGQEESAQISEKSTQ